MYMDPMDKDELEERMKDIIILTRQIGARFRQAQDEYYIAYSSLTRAEEHFREYNKRQAATEELAVQVFDSMVEIRERYFEGLD